MRANIAHSATCSCSCSTQSLAGSFAAARIFPSGPARRLRSGRPARTTLVRSSPENKGGDDSTEKLFLRELQKRGINSRDDLDRLLEAASKEDPSMPQITRSQLAESRKLNSEGLEGLIPRAKQLITLGGTFFLAFVPFILVVSLAFSGLYWAFGEGFIHGGKPSYQPYIDPAELLNEPTVDERIPF